MSILKGVDGLKSYFSIEEVARKLSEFFGQPIVSRDVFQLAKEGHLTLSVKIKPNNEFGVRLGEVVPRDQVNASVVRLYDIFSENFGEESDTHDPFEDEIAALGGNHTVSQIESGKVVSHELLRAINDKSYSLHLKAERFQDDQYVIFDQRVSESHGLWEIVPEAGGDWVLDFFDDLSQGCESEGRIIGSVWVRSSTGSIGMLCERLPSESVSRISKELTEAQSNWNQPRYFCELAKMPKCFEPVVKPESLTELVEKWTQANEKPAPPNNEAKLLEVLGLLAHSYARKAGPKFQKANQPNVSQLVEELLVDVETSGVSSGFGKSTLSQILSDSISYWRKRINS